MLSACGIQGGGHEERGWTWSYLYSQKLQLMPLLRVFLQAQRMTQILLQHAGCCFLPRKKELESNLL